MIGNKLVGFWFNLESSMLNLGETFSYCNYCLDRAHAVQKTYNNIPESPTVYLKSQGMYTNLVPQHNTNCNLIKKSAELLIVSPRNKGVYYLEQQNNQELELKASCPDQNCELY
ncbi:MAG: hypothetical protein ACRCVT_12110 [Leadbetterella sp.]